MDDMISANPWAESGPKIVTLPIQVPLTAKVSLRLGDDITLSRPFGSPDPDVSNRVKILNDRILVTAYCGEEIHIRWVESGGDQITDLPPDPTDSTYYFRIGIFRPSPFSRKMTLLLTRDGEIADITEPLVFHHWLDDYYQPSSNRSVRILFDLGIWGPLLVTLVAGWVFQVEWAKALLPWIIGLLTLAGLARLTYEMLSERRLTGAISWLQKMLKMRRGR